MERQKHVFYAHGMHCNSCVLLIESTLGELEQVSTVKASLGTCCVEVEGNFEGYDKEEVAAELSRALTSHGYSLALNQEKKVITWFDFKWAIPIALVFVTVFLVLQKMGLVNLIGAGEVTYGTALVIGLVASLSTCMAVVGGLLLSMSATFAKEGDKVKPQLMFHASRLISFFILGGVIGAIGAAFTLNVAATFILSLLIGLVMLILGINLLDIFPQVKKWQPAMPKFVAKRAHSMSQLNHSLTPLLVGAATFFLPCGFTQSMQLYTLTTGNFWQGGLTMLVYALGTLPVLGLISFSSFSISKSPKAGIFFKTAGLIVIMFAVFNLINSLVVIGLLAPVFNF